MLLHRNLNSIVEIPIKVLVEIHNSPLGIGPLDTPLDTPVGIAPIDAQNLVPLLPVGLNVGFWPG